MTAGRRVLYIDDDAALARLVTRDLRRHGYEVVTAPSGGEGVRLAAEGGFDAICLDHYMPGQDGLETIALLRALPELPPIVYVTGSEEGRVAVAALRAGAADYVIKEVGEEFQVLLRSAIAGAVEREELRRHKEEAQREMRAGPRPGGGAGPAARAAAARGEPPRRQQPPAHRLPDPAPAFHAHRPRRPVGPGRGAGPGLRRGPGPPPPLHLRGRAQGGAGRLPGDADRGAGALAGAAAAAGSSCGRRRSRSPPTRRCRWASSPPSW